MDITQVHDLENKHIRVLTSSSVRLPKSWITPQCRFIVR